MSESLARAAYSGDHRSLVIAIDFGTTYSGVSYAFLEPGLSPKIRSVTGFRGQEDQDSSTKVPTVLLYDNAGVLRAAGAQINDPEIAELAETEGWTRIEWFKLLLRPKDMPFAPELENAPVPELPPRKTVEMLLGDFFRYMKTCAQEYISRAHAAGASMWKEIRDHIKYVLSHPNGWDGFQQDKLRTGAILGGLIPDSIEGRSRIRFVSEGEASFHWCVESGLARESLKAGSDIVVVDAGGGTIDVSAFRVTKSSPLQLEETKPSECRLAGSIFVTQAFENYLQDYLEDSAFGDSDTIGRLKIAFERKTKRLFRAEMRTVSVTFGGPREHDAAYNIRSGKLVLKGEEVATFFEHACSSAVDAIRAQTADNKHTVVYLVGGFAASPYLFSEIQRRLLDSNISVDLQRAESHTAKAVADGAVGFFLDQYIYARVARYTYGIICHTLFDLTKPSHRKRTMDAYIEPLEGKIWLYGRFKRHLDKGTVVKETSTTKVKLYDNFNNHAEAHGFQLELYAYKGKTKDIEWLDEDEGGFHQICTFNSAFPPECLDSKSSSSGREFWRIDYDAVVSFGTTEFQCFFEWEDKQGGLMRGPMSAVWKDG